MTEVLKIRLKTGRIITLTVSEKTDSTYFGKDLFGEEVAISKNDIESLYTRNER